MSKRYIVTGTDTDVGKTVFAAGLAGYLATHYWKPVQAGLAEETDSQAVARLSGSRAQVLPEVYRLHTPCSPHEAARLDGVTIDPALLTLPQVDGPLIVEGAGGALVPLRDDLLSAEQFARWGLPVIVVARTSLGTINHSLLTIEALRARNIQVHGIAFSGDEVASSEAAIIRAGNVRHLGRIPRLDPLNADSLSSAFIRNIDCSAFV